MRGRQKEAPEKMTRQFWATAIASLGLVVAVFSLFVSLAGQNTAERELEYTIQSNTRAIVTGASSQVEAAHTRAQELLSAVGQFGANSCTECVNAAGDHFKAAKLAAATGLGVAGRQSYTIPATNQAAATTAASIELADQATSGAFQSLTQPGPSTTAELIDEANAAWLLVMQSNTELVKASICDFAFETEKGTVQHASRCPFTPTMTPPPVDGLVTY